MRLDQDINFEVGGVPCKMELDTTVPEWHDGDMFVIKPRDPSYIPGHGQGNLHEFGKHFASRIGDALDNLMGLDDDGLAVRETRQQYEFEVHDKYAVLNVKAKSEELTLNVGIMMSLPDWDGDSFDFDASKRLARLLADWKDGVPDIQFTRSDGRTIEFENFLNGGTPPFIKQLNELDDFYASLDRE